MVWPALRFIRCGESSAEKRCRIESPDTPGRQFFLFCRLSQSLAMRSTEPRLILHSSGMYWQHWHSWPREYQHTISGALAPANEIVPSSRRMEPLTSFRCRILKGLATVCLLESAGSCWKHVVCSNTTVLCRLSGM